jgi:hypothetical protein
MVLLGISPTVPQVTTAAAATTAAAQELPLLYLQLSRQNNPSFATCSCSSTHSGTCRDSDRRADCHALVSSDVNNVSRRSKKPRLYRKTTPLSLTVLVASGPGARVPGWPEFSNI